MTMDQAGSDFALVNSPAFDQKHIEKVVLAKKVGQFLSKEQLEDERKVVENVARALAADISDAVREALSFELRTSPDLPSDLAEKIALDVEDVASPFLAETPVFSDEQLAKIVLAVGDNVRVTIARRPNLPGTVTSALAKVGNEKVVRNVVRNPTAEMPEEACTHVINRFPSSLRLLDFLAERDDLPISIVADLVDKVSEACRESLTKNYNISAAQASKLTGAAAERVHTEALGRASYAQVQRYVRDLLRRGDLSDAMILEKIRDGDLMFFEVAMAERVHVPVTNVKVVLRSHREKGLQRLLGKAGIERELIPSFEAAISKAVGKAST